jgi:catechol 2,3-dioxygenase-like lactoylglutathione lyase family enzyme
VRISAVTLAVENMQRSCDFYSRIPGFAVSYGGAGSMFTTFQIGAGGARAMYLNLEKRAGATGNRDFGRIIFRTEDVGGLYSYMKDDAVISALAMLESEPRDAPWGERFFHV